MEELRGTCRHGHDRQLRIDPERAGYGAAVDDEKIFHVVALVRRIDHARARIQAHARGSEGMHRRELKIAGSEPRLAQGLEVRPGLDGFESSHRWENGFGARFEKKLSESFAARLQKARVGFVQ